MTSEEMNKWADAYITYQSKYDNKNDNPNDPLFWSVMKFFELMPHNPQMCWKAILEILYRNPQEKVLGVLAAGPLEDLIEDHGPEFIEEIELEAKENPEFRQLLKGVWESSTPEIWNRVLKARND